MIAAREDFVVAGDGPDQGLEWERVLSSTHLPWRVRLPAAESGGPALPAGGFQAAARRWLIGDLALVDCEADPCAGERRAEQVGSTDDEYLVVLLSRSGHELVTQGGRTVELRAGSAIAWDSRSPASFVVRERVAKRSLFIPRSALLEARAASASIGSAILQADSSATRLLAGYLDTLTAALPHLGPAALAAARVAAIELAIGALRTEPDVLSRAAAGPALLAAIDRFIDRNLPSEQLGTAVIAAAHGVSVRTVNRAFNASGRTVGETIRHRRLERARREVAASMASIASIASRWGFADSSHFSRAFKAQFGLSPRAFRADARSGPAAQDDGREVLYSEVPAG